MNRRRAAGIGVAVILAGLGAAGAISWANSAKDSAEAAQAQTAVVIVDTRVPKGADANTIRAATHMGTVQQKALQPGALTTEDQIGSQVALSDLLPGDQLVSGRLGTKVNDLPAGTTEMSIKLDAERAVGGELQRGSLVDIFISPDKADIETTTAGSAATTMAASGSPTSRVAPAGTTLGFRNVKVTNVQTATTTTDEKGAVKASSFIVTVALTADQGKLVAGAEYGHIWLVLESAS